MRTIKIKLPFKEDINISERKTKLMKWARTMVKNSAINIIEEKHLTVMSYMIVENPRK